MHFRVLFTFTHIGTVVIGARPRWSAFQQELQIPSVVVQEEPIEFEDGTAPPEGSGGQSDSENGSSIEEVEEEQTNDHVVDDAGCNHAADDAAAPCRLAMLRGLDLEAVGEGWQRVIKMIFQKECLQRYNEAMCEGLVVELFKGVDPKEPLGEATCKELRNLVGAHFCHTQSAGGVGALMQRSMLNRTGERSGMDTALAGKGWFGGNSPPEPTKSATWFHFKQENSGLCLASSGDGNGAAVHMAVCSHHVMNQRWRWWHDGVDKSWKGISISQMPNLINDQSGRCLDSPEPKNWGKIHMYACSSSNVNQLWSWSPFDMRGHYHPAPIVRQDSDVCLAVPNGGTGTPHMDKRSDGSWWQPEETFFRLEYSDGAKYSEPSAYSGVVGLGR